MATILSSPMLLQCEVFGGIVSLSSETWDLKWVGNICRSPTFWEWDNLSEIAQALLIVHVAGCCEKKKILSCQLSRSKLQSMIGCWWTCSGAEHQFQSPNTHWMATVPWRWRTISIIKYSRDGYGATLITRKKHEYNLTQRPSCSESCDFVNTCRLTMSWELLQVAPENVKYWIASRELRIALLTTTARTTYVKQSLKMS